MTNEEIARALRKTNWSGLNIGQKALIAAATQALLQTASKPATLAEERDAAPPPFHYPVLSHRHLLRLPQSPAHSDSSRTSSATPA
jgi:hypothetical protein